MEIDPTLAKELAESAKPYIEYILSNYVVPKLDEFVIKTRSRTKNKQNIQKFVEEYCYSLYEDVSIVHTLAFRNQDKKLEEIYQPLTISSDDTG